jgi:hypothetical protein
LLDAAAVEFNDGIFASFNFNRAAVEGAGRTVGREELIARRKASATDPRRGVVALRKKIDDPLGDSKKICRTLCT